MESTKIDFWIAVLLTFIVSALTILGEWLAARLITSGITLRKLDNIYKANFSPDYTNTLVKKEVKNYCKLESGALCWGSDLATIAISMDIIALTIWVYTPNMFPFLTKLNSGSISREVILWLFIIGIHTILFIASLILKHLNAESNGYAIPIVASFPKKAWFQNNIWMLAANLIGVFSLLTSIVIFTNAI